jgi:alanyl-tRNA synthetase
MPSAPLVLPDDPSLLFTNAGMAPFKKYFLGAAAPPFPRLTSCQKCLRTSDIEKVGATPRHLTFFEMLGNFSFGDYFKEGAIELAWSLLTDRTEGYGIDPSRLWVTVFQEDEETAALWEKLARISPSRILLRGEEDNFWKMGETGPCGPCTEILYDFRGGGLEEPPDENKNEALEIWNLVLMQFNRKADGSLERLPRQNVDTGAGLERLAWVLQGKSSVFETDLLYPIYQYYYDLFKEHQGERGPADETLVRRARIAADHIRAASFALGVNWEYEGRLEEYLRDPNAANWVRARMIVKPGNTGRDYVLRVLIRRGVAAGIASGVRHSFFYGGFSRVKPIFGKIYPETTVFYETGGAVGSGLDTSTETLKGDIGRIIRQEEENFLTRCIVGQQRFEAMLKEIAGENVFPGEKAFELHDTYGFPIELTRELAAERGLSVDMEGFQREMEGQRERARSARARETGGWMEAGEPSPSDFTGYEVLRDSGRITYLRWKNGEIQVALDRTPFYAEAGGQIGDSGVLRIVRGQDEVVVRVEDTRREVGTVLHRGRIVTLEDRAKVSPEELVGAEVVAEVDADRRAAIRRSHTATHLLHRALRDLFGEGATQAGSLVAPDYLRFDFHHSGGLSPEDIEAVENRIARWILEDRPVRSYFRSFKEAMAEGVTALFGEKYGETVRVVEIAGVSKELCGGTHLEHTLQVGAFKITGEESIGAGVRRIEAVTGLKALEWMQSAARALGKLALDLNVGIDQIASRWERFKEELSSIQKEAERWKSRYLGALVNDWGASSERVITAILEGIPAQSLSEAASAFVKKHPDRAVAVGSVVADRVSIVLSYGDRFEAPKPADALIKEVAPLIGGGGGGRPRFAQAGGSNPAALPAALSAIKSALL